MFSRSVRYSREANLIGVKHQSVTEMGKEEQKGKATETEGVREMSAVEFGEEQNFQRAEVKL